MPQERGGGSQQQQQQQQQRIIWMGDTIRVWFGGDEGSLAAVLTVHASLAIYAFCYQISAVVLPYLAEEVDMDTVQYGGLIATFCGLQFVGGILFGRAGDIFGSKTMMVVAHVSALVSYLMMSLSSTQLGLYLSEIPGLLQHGMQGSNMLIAHMSSGQQRIKALGRLGFSYGIGAVLGPLICSHMDMVAIWVNRTVTPIYQPLFGKSFAIWSGNAAMLWLCIGFTIMVVGMIYLLVPSRGGNQQYPKTTRSKYGGDNPPYSHQFPSIKTKEKKGHEKENATTMSSSSAPPPFPPHNQKGKDIKCRKKSTSSTIRNDKNDSYPKSLKKRRHVEDESTVASRSNDEHHHHTPPHPPSPSSSSLAPLPPLHQSSFRHRSANAAAADDDDDDDDDDECKRSTPAGRRKSNPGVLLASTSPSERTALISGDKYPDNEGGGGGGGGGEGGGGAIKGMQGKLRNVFSLTEILRLGRYKFVRRLLLAKLGIMFPSALFMSMFAQFCVTEFRFEPKRTGRLLSYVPLVRMIGQGLLVNPLVKLFSETLMIRASCFVIALSMLFIGYATTELELYLVLLPLNLSGAVAIVVISGLLTQAVPEADTGGVLGLDHAVLSFAYIIGPLVSGWIYELYGFVILGYLGALIATFTGVCCCVLDIGDETPCIVQMKRQYRKITRCCRCCRCC